MTNFIMGIAAGMIGLFAILLIVDRCMGESVWFTPFDILCELLRDVVGGLLYIGNGFIEMVKSWIFECPEAYEEDFKPFDSEVEEYIAEDIGSVDRIRTAFASLEKDTKVYHTESECVVDRRAYNTVGINDNFTAADMAFIDEMVEYCEGR